MSKPKLTDDQQSAIFTLARASGKLEQAIKFGTKAEVFAAECSMIELRAHAERIGCDVSDYSDARFAAVKPVPEQKKNSGRYL